jgi:hypothetical protein
MSTSPNHKAGYIPTFRSRTRDMEQAIMNTYRPEFEARKQARHAIEDLQFERQQREVWEQSL